MVNVPVSLQNNKLISKNGILWYFIILCAKYLRLDYLILDFYLKQDVYSVWRKINHPVLTDKSQHSLDFIIFYVSSLNGVLIQESELKKTQIHFTPKSNGTRAIYSVWHGKWISFFYKLLQTFSDFKIFHISRLLRKNDIWGESQFLISKIHEIFKVSHLLCVTFKVTQTQKYSFCIHFYLYLNLDNSSNIYYLRKLYQH